MFNRYFNKGLADSYWQDGFVKLNFFLSLVANILLWLFIFSRMNNFSGMIPLHYNIYFGIDLLDYWYKIFYLPGLGSGLLALNFILGAMAYKQEKVLSHFLAGCTTFIQLVLVLSTLSIIWINL